MNVVFVCEGNFTNQDCIGICTDIKNAEKIITEYFFSCFQSPDLILKRMGDNDVYSYKVIRVDGTGVVKNFAEINPITLNERLF